MCFYAVKFNFCFLQAKERARERERGRERESERERERGERVRERFIQNGKYLEFVPSTGMICPQAMTAYRVLFMFIKLLDWIVQQLSI